MESVRRGCIGAIFIATNPKRQTLRDESEDPLPFSIFTSRDTLQKHFSAFLMHDEVFRIIDDLTTHDTSTVKTKDADLTINIRSIGIFACLALEPRRTLAFPHWVAYDSSAPP